MTEGIAKGPVRKLWPIGRAFLFSGLAWGLIGVVIGWIRFRGGDPGELFRQMKWLCGLWLLSMVDLFSLVQGVGLLVRLSADGSAAAPDSEKQPRENRTFLIIQTSYWVTLKLACWLLLSLVLLKGKAIPLYGLLFGLGTLAVVPLLGGIMWSQRISRHA